jgi:hypothetical protein
MTKPNHSVISGGISKINTSDNAISLYMSDEMRLQGDMMAYFIKTRSSAGVGKSSLLALDVNNLRITDPVGGQKPGIMPTKRKADKGALGDMKSPSDVTANIKGLPSIAEQMEELNPLPDLDLFQEEHGLKKIPVTTEDSDALINLMQSLGD